MLIAHVHFTVAPDDVPTALAALLSEVATVRARPGCRTFLPFLDPTQAGAVGLIHEWDDTTAFAAYTASPGFAAVGTILRPLMTAAPVSKRFDATLMETVA